LNDGYRYNAQTQLLYNNRHLVSTAYILQRISTILKQFTENTPQSEGANSDANPHSSQLPESRVCSDERVVSRGVSQDPVASSIRLHRLPKKTDTKLMAVTLLFLKRFSNFLTVRFSSKFAAKYY